jgi:hypothetical protein
METITAIKTKNGLIPESTVRLILSADDVLPELYYSEGLSKAQRRIIAKTRKALDKITKNVENQDDLDDPFI